MGNCSHRSTDEQMVEFYDERPMLDCPRCYFATATLLEGERSRSTTGPIVLSIPPAQMANFRKASGGDRDKYWQLLSSYAGHMWMFGHLRYFNEWQAGKYPRGSEIPAKAGFDLRFVGKVVQGELDWATPRFDLSSIDSSASCVLVALRADVDGEVRAKVHSSKLGYGVLPGGEARHKVGALKSAGTGAVHAGGGVGVQGDRQGARGSSKDRKAMVKGKRAAPAKAGI